MFRNKETCPESDNLQYKKRYYTPGMREQQDAGRKETKWG